MYLLSLILCINACDYDYAELCSCVQFTDAIAGKLYLKSKNCKHRKRINTAKLYSTTSTATFTVNYSHYLCLLRLLEAISPFLFGAVDLMSSIYSYTGSLVLLCTYFGISKILVSLHSVPSKIYSHTRGFLFHKKYKLIINKIFRKV